MCVKRERVLSDDSVRCAQLNVEYEYNLCLDFARHTLLNAHTCSNAIEYRIVNVLVDIRYSYHSMHITTHMAHRYVDYIVDVATQGTTLCVCKCERGFRWSLTSIAL